MPSPLSSTRMLTAALGLALALSACGDSKESANSVDVQMKDLETVDGTINDAMIARETQWHHLADHRLSVLHNNAIAHAADRKDSDLGRVDDWSCEASSVAAHIRDRKC